MIQSVKRAFDILEYITQNGNLVRLNDIANALELQNTTVHNLLHTLKELGYVEQDELSPRYRVTTKMQCLYPPPVSVSVLKNTLRPTLEKITELTNETSYLSVQMGTYFRHELISEPERSVKISLELNKDYEMTRTAIGKVFMAHSEHLQNTLLKNLDEPVQKKLQQELSEILKNGYALDLEEYEPDLNCAAIPYYQGNRVVAVLCVSGPAFRYRLPEMLKAIEIMNGVE